MEEEMNPSGEFHHFQLVSSDGDIPLSISVLVHYNRQNNPYALERSPIGTNEILELHDALQNFDGDYQKAFKGI